MDSNSKRLSFLAGPAQEIADSRRLGIVVLAFHGKGCRHGIDNELSKPNTKFAAEAFVDGLELIDEQLEALKRGEVGQLVYPRNRQRLRYRGIRQSGGEAIWDKCLALGGYKDRPHPLNDPLPEEWQFCCEADRLVNLQEGLAGA